MQRVTLPIFLQELVPCLPPRRTVVHHRTSESSDKQQQTPSGSARTLRQIYEADRMIRRQRPCSLSWSSLDQFILNLAAIIANLFTATSDQLSTQSSNPDANVTNRRLFCQQSTQHPVIWTTTVRRRRRRPGVERRPPGGRRDGRASQPALTRPARRSVGRLNHAAIPGSAPAHALTRLATTRTDYLRLYCTDTRR